MVNILLVQFKIVTYLVTAIWEEKIIKSLVTSNLIGSLLGCVMYFGTLQSWSLFFTPNLNLVLDLSNVLI